MYPNVISLHFIIQLQIIVNVRNNILCIKINVNYVPPTVLFAQPLTYVISVMQDIAQVKLPLEVSIVK